MTNDGADLFNQLIFPQKQPTNQYQGLTIAPSNALAQGNVLLKITCGEDIRCRSVSEDYGWEDLQYTIQQMFAAEISPRDPIQLRFRDADGDWVTMASEDEYNLAKQLSPKLHICVSQKEQPKRNLNIPQFRKALVRLREEINSFLEFLPTQGANEGTPDTSPPTTQPPDSNKKQKEPPAPDALMNSVLDVIEESKPVRTVSPQQALPVLPPAEPPRQYSNLNLPPSIMPNSSQVFQDFGMGMDQHIPPASRAAPIAPPAVPTSTLPSAPTTVPSASSLFHTQNIPFNVPQPPYPPQGFGPQQPTSYYHYYPK